MSGPNEREPFSFTLTRAEAVEVVRALGNARKAREKRLRDIRDYPDQDPDVPRRMREAGADQLARIESALAAVRRQLDEQIVAHRVKVQANIEIDQMEDR